MKKHEFNVNSKDQLDKVAIYLHNNRIEENDVILVKVNAKNPNEFNEKVSSFLNHSFCNFIDICRNGVNGFEHTKTYDYPKSDTSILNTANELGFFLSLNTKLNIEFVRTGNEYVFELPSDDKIEDISNKIGKFFLSNTITSGDSVKLLAKNGDVNYISKNLYYYLIALNIKTNANIYQLPSMHLDLSNMYFDSFDNNNSKFLARLSMSGINFSIGFA